MVAWNRDVFAGGGEARAAARAVNWSGTSLGPREHWSDDTLAVVDLCLSLDVPAMVCWGPELIQVYNESCCPLLGRRHPAAMGQAGRDCWAQLWEDVAPDYERLSRSVDAVHARGVRLPAPIGESRTNAALDLTFVPISDAAEGVAGGLLILAREATETPERRRQARGVSTIAGIADVTAAAVGAARAYDELLRRCDALAVELEARSRFTASVAHELRTPLNAIVAHAELLKEGFVGRLDERQTRHVDRVATAAMHLLELIEDTLELSRADRGVAELTVRDADLGALADELGDLFRPLFRARGLEFGIRIQRDLRPIRTDASRVRQILVNLLSNAQKYTDAGSVELVVAQEGDGSTTVAVTDTGRGIDVSDHTRIFEPFRRMPRAGDREGTGLGLTVAESLARLLGGALAVRSEPGVGSTFTLRIPDLPYSAVAQSPSPRIVQ